MAKQTDPNPLAVSIPKAANTIGICETKLRQMIYDGTFPAAFQVGRRWIIPVKALEQWLDEQVKA